MFCKYVLLQQIIFDLNQRHYIKVQKGDIFMKQKMRLGLVSGWLAINTKKNGANYEKLLKTVFSCFQGQKKIEFPTKKLQIYPWLKIAVAALLYVLKKKERDIVYEYSNSTLQTAS